MIYQSISGKAPPRVVRFRERTACCCSRSTDMEPLLGSQQVCYSNWSKSSQVVIEEKITTPFLTYVVIKIDGINLRTPVQARKIKRCSWCTFTSIWISSTSPHAFLDSPWFFTRNLTSYGKLIRLLGKSSQSCRLNPLHTPLSLSSMATPT